MKTINKFCPRSGKPVSSDSLTVYKDLTVGFCNPGCRDDFRDNINDRIEDRKYFDVLIKELVPVQNNGNKINVARTNLIDFMMFEKDR